MKISYSRFESIIGRLKTIISRFTTFAPYFRSSLDLLTDQFQFEKENKE